MTELSESFTRGFHIRHLDIGLQPDKQGIRLSIQSIITANQNTAVTLLSVEIKNSVEILVLWNL